ncbi:MAG TPA: CPBP family intramembrane glutamic endopeptidase [Candidatus Eisenbacteria bacterium]|nr:CPBP family intramembrane glutamic endopeptidase [Candidatus Eisenbacteria bacterium]
MRGGTPGRARLFWILVGASLVTTLGSVPYLIALLEQVPGAAGGRFETRGALPYLATAIQGLLFTIPTAWAGLRLAPRAGFSMMVPPARRALRIGVLAGLAVGIGLLALTPVLPEITPKFPLQPAEWWKGLLASASAGVNEEIWFRLGIMTALVAAGMALFRRGSSSAVPAEEPVVPPDETFPTPAAQGESRVTAPIQAPGWIVWPANAIAALLFGALHLPQADMIAGLTPPIVAFTLVGNGIAGMAFGWLYWKQGLLSAMAAHFSTDIVLHVIAPLGEA